MFQDEHGSEDESESVDGFCDIYNEAAPNDEVEEKEVDVKEKNKFQKFIKKISRPS